MSGPAVGPAPPDRSAATPGPGATAPPEASSTAPPGREAAGDAPSPALAPPPGNPRFPLLDGVRALAALGVVLTHAAATSSFNVDNPLGAFTARLNVGVALFFVLSGFLLYRPFVTARREGRPPVRVRDYARRRVLRIVPAYWVALTVLALWPGLVAFWDGPWWRSYAFTQVYWSESVLQGIYPAWTLCVEVSFYVALPFLAAAIGRVAGRSTRAELGVLAVLAAASLAARAVAPVDGVLQNTIACHLDWFAYGMALAVVSVAAHGREERSAALRLVARRPSLAWAGAAAAFAVASLALGLPRDFSNPDGRGALLGQHLLYAAVAVLIVLPAVFGDRAGGLPRRLLAWRPVAWLGVVSYGLFLWHGPLVQELQRKGADDWLPGSGYLSLVAVTLAAGVACAAASYYLVERPLLRFKERGSRTARRASAARASAPDADAATARHAAALSGSDAAASRASRRA